MLTLKMIVGNYKFTHDGLRAKAEYCSRTNSCPHYDTRGGVAGKQYYGRGYIQLTHAYNYAAASKALYGDDRLVKNPDLVKNEEVAWRVSFWYWKNRVHPYVQDGHFDKATKR